MDPSVNSRMSDSLGTLLDTDQLGCGQPVKLYVALSTALLGSTTKHAGTSLLSEFDTSILFLLVQSTLKQLETNILRVDSKLTGQSMDLGIFVGTELNLG